MTNGIFSKEFAERRVKHGQWKLDEGLANALLHLVEHSKPSFAVDLGAGIGLYVQLFRDAGIRATGYDGIEGITRLGIPNTVKQADLTDPGFVCPCADMAICIETGEHIPEDKLPAFIRNVAKAATKTLVVSWAVPNQRGRDHVSCHSPEWVACEFGHHAWHVDESMTAKCREIAGKGWDKKLLVFGN